MECRGAISPWDNLLYDSGLLTEIKLEDWPKVSFEPKITIDNPGEALCLRPLKRSDYENGYMNLLSQLTQVGEVSKDQFLQTFQKMKDTPNTYYITVVEDSNTGEVIGTATLLLEQKFIRDCAKRGRVEDVVVSDLHRGKQLGKLLLSVTTLLAKHLGCYKITLDCRDIMIPFYESLGYEKEASNGNFMTVRYNK